MPYLIDDGTLDTVIRCECGREHRFNYDGSFGASDDVDLGCTYDEFVDDCIADVADTCECHEGEK